LTFGALATIGLLIAAMAFAYLFCNFLDALTIHPELVMRLDKEFEIADGKIQELRQDGETNDGGDGTKVDQRSNK
jgi:hypothetical protein